MPSTADAPLSSWATVCSWAFRIGVRLGDIIVEGDDLYGDGVNIASRLEGIAERGGICISRQAYDQVQKKLALGYRSLGPKNLKNIPDQIEAFAIQGDGLAIADERQEIRYCRTTDSVRLAYASRAFPCGGPRGPRSAFPSCSPCWPTRTVGRARPEEGLKQLTEAARSMEIRNERVYETELHRIRGELLISVRDFAGAKDSFREAIAVAQRQSAKLFELRAAMSMARLWRDQGKRKEARDLLAPVYGWFTEGFDTRDLKEAKALLDELGA